MHPGTQIKPFTAERTKIIMAAFRVCAANPCHSIQIITAGKKMFTDIHYTVKMKFAVFLCVLFFIDITKISKMFLENGMKNIPASGKITLGFG
jgi:hypothetical protein